MLSDFLPRLSSVNVRKADGEPVLAGKKRLAVTARVHDGRWEPLIDQETVSGVFNDDCFSRILRIEFQCVLSPIRCRKDKKVRVGNDNAFFFFIMPEFPKRKKTADMFDIFSGWVEVPFVQQQAVSTSEETGRAIDHSHLSIIFLKNFDQKLSIAQGAGILADNSCCWLTVVGLPLDKRERECYSWAGFLTFNPVL